jgi:CBS domain-containing protein
VTAPADRMTIADAMHRGVVACDVATPLPKVAQMMVGHRIHCVIVRSNAQQDLLWGVISDLDLAATVAERPAEEVSAGEIALTPPVVIDIRDPLRRAARLMTEHGVSHLVVVKQGRPVGVISTLDLARVVADGNGQA